MKKKYKVQVVERRYSMLEVEAESNALAQIQVLDKVSKNEVPWEEPTIELWRVDEEKVEDANVYPEDPV